MRHDLTVATAHEHPSTPVTAQQNTTEAGTTTEQLAAGSEVRTRTLSDAPDRGAAANVLGFAAQASIWAVLGSSVSRTEDL